MNSQSIKHVTEETLFSNVLVDFIQDAAFCLGADARFLYINDATCLLLEYSVQELLSMTLLDIASDFNNENWLKQWQIITQQGSSRFHCWCRTKSDRAIFVEIAIAYKKELDKEFCCASMRELSQEASETQPQNNNEIEDIIESDRSLEENSYRSELKARFFSAVCHQLRSFLNIISFSNSLLKRSLNESSETTKLLYIENIQTAVEQIGTLLDRLIFLGQSEVGKIKLKLKATDVKVLCRDLIAQIESNNDGKQHTIEFVCQERDGFAYVDRDLLQHIIENLLSNALKYTPKGGRIKLKLTCKPKKLVVQVKDTGIGIPPVERSRIFEPFFRGSNIDNISGNGLGLAIVKNLVDLHGGQVTVESKVGVGTTFTVIFPLFSLPVRE
jgi:signal transduction histidine kinase